MGFNGTLQTVTYGAEDRSWLKPVQGSSGAFKSITLDMSLFTPATHFPDGYIPSGITLGRVTATGLYGPYVTAAVDGTGVLAGFLFNTETVVADDAKITTALVREGVIVETNLPADHGLDATGKADLPSMWYE